MPVLGANDSRTPSKKATVPCREPGLDRQPFSSFSAAPLDDIAAVPGFHFFTETMRAKTFDIGFIR